jgi:hypothetical protein
MSSHGENRFTTSSVDDMAAKASTGFSAGSYAGPAVKPAITQPVG